MKFSIKIKPKGKDRPRFARRGNYVQTYTTKNTKDYEETIKRAFLGQCKGEYDKEYIGPVKIEIWAFFEPPKSYSKKKRIELIDMPHLKKCDLDNIVKIVLDSLNGVAWKDDSQIYHIKASKYYAETDKLEVEIKYE